MNVRLPSSLQAAVAYDSTDSGRPHRVRHSFLLVFCHQACFVIKCAVSVRVH